MGEVELIYPDLSYKIVGASFRVFNEMGWGLSEVHYQKALAKEFELSGVGFKREVYVPVQYRGEKIARAFVDFIVEEKVILELKVVSKLGYSQSRQLLAYLQNTGIKLGILIYFTREGVKYRRVLNSKKDD